ncbi:glycosyltransferase family 4 protein [Streptomyces sp. HSG2]|uniref:glycosyltransferase family 4 protein n=1 Tax=Streptomyces sp. HSG2 TaxID=2797167 RepID=UPI001907ED24|nr:glycosyltransferase family 4 protein [Streptomyces sp. HSG2]
MTPQSSPPPHGPSFPLRTVQVLGGGHAGSSAHVRSLAAGLVARGVKVTVCAPVEAERTHDFSGTGAHHVHVPRSGDPVSVAALRALCADADLVHAHGLHASIRSVLALGGWRERIPLVVTRHGRSRAEGPRARLLRGLEHGVLRAATVVLGTTSESVEEARAGGARDARLSAVAQPWPENRSSSGSRPRPKVRADVGAVGRPLLVTVGGTDRHDGCRDVLLDAALAWRDLTPPPLVVLAGPLPEQSRGRVVDDSLPVAFVGDEDLSELLAAADLALLPGPGEDRAGFAQRALRARVPLVAADVGAVRDLVGDAAEVVPRDDAVALARAVVELLDDPARREALREAAARRVATWPTEEETVTRVLSVYDELTRPGPLL